MRTHLHNGAEVIQVLQAPFAHVILAEKPLKQHHAQEIQRRARRGMPASFGQGTEVAGRRMAIQLTDVLADAEDVT